MKPPIKLLSSHKDRRLDFVVEFNMSRKQPYLKSLSEDLNEYINN